MLGKARLVLEPDIEDNRENKPKDNKATTLLVMLRWSPLFLMLMPPKVQHNNTYSNNY